MFTKQILIISATLLLPLLVLAQPKRIVSLSPSLTTNLIELGAQNLIVGCTNYCDLAFTNESLIVANAIDINIEKLVSLKPDIVLYSTLTKPQYIKTIESVGIKTHFFDVSTNFEVICNQFIEIGSLLGKTQQAQLIINELKQKVDSIKPVVLNNKKYKIFIEIGAKPLFTAIPNTYMHDFIVLLGGQNIAQGMVHGTISREKVIADNPDFIFLVTMGLVSNEEIKIWNQYKQMNAVKNNSIFVVDAYKACQPTPQNFVWTLTEMHRLINSVK